MLKNKKVVIAHGVQQRQDTVFLAYKKQFDQLSESDFVDFWCIYLMSLAYEQFIRADDFRAVLTNCSEEIAAFKDAYRKAGLPDFGGRKSLMELLGWVLPVLKGLKPKATWTPPDNVGQFELSLGDNVQNSQVGPKDADPRMPVYIDAIASRLEEMVDRLDELFARRSETETHALRGLLQTLRLFRSDRIRVKIFLRDDILDQIIGDQGFTALTHVTARRSDTLRWSEEQILTMIVRRIFANDNVCRHFNVDKKLVGSSIEYQRQKFYKVFASHVHRPPNQSSTLRWIYNHTKDGRGVVTPRDVISLLTRAIQWQRDAFRRDQAQETEQLISAPAILYGLEEMSKEKRTNYLVAEFPHKWGEIKKLVGGGTEYSDAAIQRLLGKKHQATAEDLISIGVLERRATKDGAQTFRVPYLYRHGLECTQRFVP